MGEDAVGVAVALAELKGSMNTGFAEINGKLDVTLQRTSVVERDLGDLDGEVEALEGRLSTVERKLWLMAGFAACAGAGGGAGLWQILGS